MKLSICRPWPTRKNAAPAAPTQSATSRAAAKPYETFTGGASGDRLRPMRRHTATTTSAAPAATRSPSRRRDERLSTRHTSRAIIRAARRRSRPAPTAHASRGGVPARRTRRSRPEAGSATQAGSDPRARRTAIPTASAVASRSNGGTRSRYCLDRRDRATATTPGTSGTAIRIGNARCHVRPAVHQQERRGDHQPVDVHGADVVLVVEGNEGERLGGEVHRKHERAVILAPVFDAHPFLMPRDDQRRSRWLLSDSMKKFSDRLCCDRNETALSRRH